MSTADDSGASTEGEIDGTTDGGHPDHGMSGISGPTAGSGMESGTGGAASMGMAGTSGGGPTSSEGDPTSADLAASRTALDNIATSSRRSALMRGMPQYGKKSPFSPLTAKDPFGNPVTVGKYGKYDQSNIAIAKQAIHTKQQPAKGPHFDPKQAYMDKVDDQKQRDYDTNIENMKRDVKQTLAKVNQVTVVTYFGIPHNKNVMSKYDRENALKGLRDKWGTTLDAYSKDFNKAAKSAPKDPNVKGLLGTLAGMIPGMSAVQALSGYATEHGWGYTESDIESAIHDAEDSAGMHEGEHGAGGEDEWRKWRKEKDVDLNSSGGGIIMDVINPT
jgi:hypothetical protein